MLVLAPMHWPRNGLVACLPPGARLEWFHDNALKLSPYLKNARRSTALEAWHRIGLKHPPSLESFRKARKTALHRLQSSEEKTEAFLDCEAFNRLLGEKQATRDLFVHLAKTNPAAARRAIPEVLPALIQLNTHETITRLFPYPKTLISDSITVLRLSKKMSMANGMSSTKSEDRFENEAATLAALLVRAGPCWSSRGGDSYRRPGSSASFWQHPEVDIDECIEWCDA